MKRFLLLCLLAACPGPRAATGTTSAGAAAQPDTAPRLVVLLVIDQFPEWTFETRHAAFTHGFARLRSEGEWRAGRHPSIATYTASGHALLGTGEPPARTGIIGNKWWSRELGRVVEAAEGTNGKPSAWSLRVPALGDAVVAAGTGAKAVAVALKARASRLPLGQGGLAIYYDSKTGAWGAQGSATRASGAAASGPPVAAASPASGAAAAPAELAWLAEYNRAHPVKARLTPWTPLDAARLAQLSGTVDAQPGEAGSKGFGTTFPHDPNATAKPLDAVLAMPLGDELTFDVAEAALDGEQLGRDRVPDLLVISCSAHDYIAHGFGHESWEAWDHELRIDVRLGKFLDALDAKVGRGRWAMIVTSDHGGAPLPERSKTGRYSYEQLQRAANAAASTVLGDGNWVTSAQYPSVWLSPAALAQPKRELANAYKKIVSALRSFPGLAVADRADAFKGNCEQRTGDARAICLALDPERSGDFVYAPAHGWILVEEAEPAATAHLSPYDYDRLVPVLLLPFGRTIHPPQSSPSGEMALTEVASVLRTWLGLRPDRPGVSPR